MDSSRRPEPKFQINMGNYKFYLDKVMEHILVNYRWLFVIFFLLPLSVVYDVLYFARTWFIFHLSSAPKQHDKKVKDIQRQIREWMSSGGDKAMCTARPGWQTISFREPKYKETLHRINVNLVDILEVDVYKRTVRAEPLVSMGQLTALLDPLGWSLPVLPELDDLTAGGLVMGCGIETSSHKYGLFQHICVSFELALADGSVVTCSKEENPDLFNAIPWSHGTLGFITAVELKIIPNQRFVKLEYQPVHSLGHALDVFRSEVEKEDGNQFVEGIMFNRDQGVIMTGNMVSSADPYKLNQLSKWYKPWFYKHVEGFLRTGKGVEYIPLRDYFHRHTRSMFWNMQEIIPFGNNALFRFFLGWMMPPKVSLLKLTQTKAVKKLFEEHFTFQDMLVPMKNLQESIEFFDQEAKVYPVWLCPMKLPSQPGMVHSRDNKDEMYVDIGLYGMPKVSGFHPVETVRKLEAFVRKVNGFQMLYADTYMTKEEFRKMFDHSLYDEMREKMNCKKAFPDVFDKVGRHART